MYTAVLSALQNFVDTAPTCIVLDFEAGMWQAIRQHDLYATTQLQGCLFHFSYSPNGRFLVQETFPKTLPQFVLILISLQRWQHRVRNETKHFVSPHLIGPQFTANQHETNQHESAELIVYFR